jgi:hypothetical protein
MKFFGKSSEKTLALDQDELRERLMDAINRELNALIEKQKQLGIQIKYGPASIGYGKTEPSQFARIWTLAAAFGLLSVVPLVILSDRYPWAVLAVVIGGSICTATIDLLSPMKEQEGTLFIPTVKLQSLQPLDLSHRETIDVSMFYEREYWSKHLGISEDELREAVLTVGPNVTTLKAYLEYKKTKESNPPTSPN